MSGREILKRAIAFVALVGAVLPSAALASPCAGILPVPAKPVAKAAPECSMPCCEKGRRADDPCGSPGGSLVGGSSANSVRSAACSASRSPATRLVAAKGVTNEVHAEASIASLPMSPPVHVVASGRTTRLVISRGDSDPPPKPPSASHGDRAPPRPDLSSAA